MDWKELRQLCGLLLVYVGALLLAVAGCMLLAHTAEWMGR